MELSYVQLPQEVRFQVAENVRNLGSYSSTCRIIVEDVRTPYFLKHTLFKPFVLVLQTTFSLNEREIRVVLGEVSDYVLHGQGDCSSALIGRVNAIARVLKEQRKVLPPPVQQSLTLSRLDDFARELHRAYAAYGGDFGGELYERLINAIALRNFIASSLLLAVPRVTEMGDERLWEVVALAISGGATKVVKDLSGFLNLERMNDPRDPLIGSFNNAYFRAVVAGDDETVKAVLNMAFSFTDHEPIILVLLHAFKHNHLNIIQIILDCEDYREMLGSKKPNDLQAAISMWGSKLRRERVKNLFRYAAEGGYDGFVKMCLMLDWTNGEIGEMLMYAKEGAAEAILGTEPALKIVECNLDNILMSTMVYYRYPVVKAIFASNLAYKISNSTLRSMLTTVELREDQEMISLITDRMAKNSTWTN